MVRSRWRRRADLVEEADAEDGGDSARPWMTPQADFVFERGRERVVVVVVFVTRERDRGLRDS